jgi:hypothetical protein
MIRTAIAIETRPDRRIRLTHPWGTLSKDKQASDEHQPARNDEIAERAPDDNE